MIYLVSLVEYRVTFSQHSHVPFFSNTLTHDYYCSFAYTHFFLFYSFRIKTSTSDDDDDENNPEDKGIQHTYKSSYNKFYTSAFFVH